MNNLVFWALFPFAVPQAVKIRRRALRLPPPRCEPAGVEGEGKPLRLVALGDSVIVGVGVDYLRDAYVGQAVASLANQSGRAVHWSVHGRSGARAEHLLDDFLHAIPEQPADVILLSVGVNDITGMTPLPAFKARLMRLIAELRARSPDAVIGVAGIPPLHVFPLLPQPLRFASGQRGRAFDRAIRRIAGRFEGVVHMPILFEKFDDAFCEDGFHPSKASYAVFGRQIADLVLAEAERSTVDD